MTLSCLPAVPQSLSFGLKASKLLRGDGKTIGVAGGGNAAQASTTATPENVLEWAKQDKRRLLHVVYRVGDLDRTIKYVCSLQMGISCCSDILWCICMMIMRKNVEFKHRNLFCMQILHRVPGNEIVAET